MSRGDAAHVPSTVPALCRRFGVLSSHISLLTSHLSPSSRDLSSVALAEAEALAEGGSLLSTVIQACHTEQHNEEPVFTGKFFTPDQGCVMDLS